MLFVPPLAASRRSIRTSYTTRPDVAQSSNDEVLDDNSSLYRLIHLELEFYLSAVVVGYIYIYVAI